MHAVVKTTHRAGEVAGSHSPVTTVPSMTQQNSIVRDLRHFRVRTSRAFDLIRHDNLPRSERETLGALTQDPDHYGVLVPSTTPSLGVLAVDQRTAAMLKAQIEPSVLPDANLPIARMIIDGILEIECDGQFISGPAAHSVIFTEPLKQPNDTHRLSAVSHRSLRTAQSLSMDDPARVAAWLYSCNSIALNPRWAKQYLSTEQIQKTLGYRSGRLYTLLDESYDYTQRTHWTSWERRLDSPGQYSIDLEQPVYKLYLSIHPQSLKLIFTDLLESIVASNVPAFKLGSDVHGILRPDKFMLYFNDFSTLSAAADNLRSVVAGASAQGVPFTAALDDNGALSWGLDPPLNERIPGWSGGESWRSWVINRLARAIVRARALGERENAWLCALDRVRLEGININQWLPEQVHWNQSGDA